MKWLFVLLTPLLTPCVWAQTTIGEPIDGALGMVKPATEIMEKINSFHNLLLVIIFAVSLLVMGLLAWVMIRYNAKANPNPKKFTHNTLIEVIWTAAPVVILIIIAAWSFPLLYYTDRFPDVSEEDVINVKVTGNQWNWTYAYMDALDEDGYPLEFTANSLYKGLTSDPRLSGNARRNLSVDYPMVVPEGKTVRLLVTASDVIHSWTIPAFGVKVDAVPGPLNQLWFRRDKPGIFYGQCSEICGKDHAFMPIEVRVVPQEDYNAWLARAMNDIDVATAYIQQVQPLPPARGAAVR